jgi:hypothetical protein
MVLALLGLGAFTLSRRLTHAQTPLVDSHPVEGHLPRVVQLYKYLNRPPREAALAILDLVSEQDQITKVITADGDPIVRAEAILALADPQVLRRLEYDNLPLQVRAAIALRLNDQDKLSTLLKARSEFKNNSNCTHEILHKMASQCTDEKVLLEVVHDQEWWSSDILHGDNFQLAQNALLSIPSLPTLLTIASSADPDFPNSLRMQAVSQIKDLPTLEYIADPNNESFSNVRESACRRIKDKQLITRIILSMDTINNDWDAASAALEKIDSQEWLMEIYRSLKNPNFREEVKQKITSEEYLCELVFNGELGSDKYIYRINQPELLRKIALNAPKVELRFFAAKRLQDKELMIKILNEKNVSSYIRAKIFSIIGDVDSLKKLYQSEKVIDQLAAISVSEDQNFLKEVINSSVAREIKLLAIRCLKDVSYLKEIVRNKNKTVSERCAAMENISDQYFLMEVVADEKFAIEIRMEALFIIKLNKKPVFFNANVQRQFIKIMSNAKIYDDDRVFLLEFISKDEFIYKITLSEAFSIRIRCEALKKLSDQKLINNIALGFKGELQKQAIAKMNSIENLINLLTQVRLEPSEYVLAGRQLFYATLRESATDINRHLPEATQLDEITQKALKFIGDAFQLKEIEFFDQGRALTTYAYANRALTSAAQSPITIPAVDSVLRDIPTPVVREKELNELIEGFSFLKAYGRTLIFQNEEGAQLAVKFLKATELQHSLEQGPLADEWQNLQVIAALAEKLKLKTALPDVSADVFGLYRVSGVPDEFVAAVLAESNKSVSGFELANPQNGHYGVLVYPHQDGMHQYLHDVKIKTASFYSASDDCMHDMARLAAAGLLNTAPADLYHNVHDGRLFRWNADSFLSAHAEVGGTGRMHNWKAAVAYSNLRMIGLADFKAYLKVDELLEKHHEAGAFKKVNDPVVFATQSVMGDNLLGWALTCTRSALERAASNEDAGHIDLETVFSSGMATFLAAYTGISLPRAQEILEHAGLDFSLMAQQFDYFGQRRYVADIAGQTGIPSDLLRPHGTGYPTRVESRLAGAGRGYQPDNGWRFDGENDDLGPVNGPFPCQELIRGIYVVTGMALVLGADPSIK